MKLCFSSYAHILKDACYNTVTNKELIQTLVNTIDPNADYVENDTQVSRLYNGGTNFPVSTCNTKSDKRRNDQPLTDIVSRAKKLDLYNSNYISLFEENIKRLIDADKIDTAADNLLDVISDDTDINDHESTFKSCTGYSVYDVGIHAKTRFYPFLAGLFLYIVLQNDNSKDSLVKSTRKDEINKEPVGIGKKSNVERYMDSIISEYSEIRTLLYSETPVPFYDFYVQNDLKRWVKNNYSSYDLVKYRQFSFSDLRKNTPFSIISGTGGLGKSMMMRHFLLSAAKEFPQTHVIPLFIRLKNFNETYKDVMDFIFDEISPLWPKISISELGMYLDEGRMLVLFDGLDEISNTLSSSFQNAASKLISRYPKNQYILSSRPFSNFSAFSRFTIYEIAPFTKEQGLELIDKLHFREDLPDIKKKFRKEFDNSLYYSHMGFSDNPLLLTIMLMTYEEFAEVPSKMHLFYQEAYTVLSKKHDASKGGYKRALETGISVDEFADIFSRFCAESYTDQKYEFSWTELDRYFRSLKDKYSSLRDKSVNAFITDACNNLCLMFLDGSRYSFVHRSFQEYFCARYFASQKDKNLDKIGKKLDHNKLSKRNDNVLKMLYDMIPEKITEYMILPYMERLINKCNEERGYYTFLKTIYPGAEMGDEDVEFDASFDPDSALYQLILDTSNITHEHINAAEIKDAYLLDYTQFYILDQTDNSTVSYLDVPSEYEDAYGEPPECGRVYELDWDSIFDDDTYSGIKKCISASGFSLYEEYKDFIELYKELRDNIEDKSEGDLFDILD